MSFSYLLCDHCDLSHYQVPLNYFTNESAEIEILMFPMGSESFLSRLGYPPSEAVKERKTGYISTLYCQMCQHCSCIADADEKLCHKCGNHRLINLDSLEDNSCPRCGVGKMRKKESVLHF